MCTAPPPIAAPPAAQAASFANAIRTDIRVALSSKPAESLRAFRNTGIGMHVPLQANADRALKSNGINRVSLAWRAL
jgi:hypothetical protein